MPFALDGSLGRLFCLFTYPPGVCYNIEMKKGTSHHKKLVSLKRIEGQIRGIQKMVEEQRYCVDIINAISAVVGALKRVEVNILKDHLNACVINTFEKNSKKEKEIKIDEICDLMRILR